MELPCHNSPIEVLFNLFCGSLEEPMDSSTVFGGYADTVYTVQQWHGETEVRGSIVKIIVSPDKEAAAISSSVQPGIDSGMGLVISPQEAVEAARTHLAQTAPEISYTFYTEQVDKATVPYTDDLEADNAQLYNVYVVYTDNPGATIEETDFPYMAHYISAEGNYLYGTPTFRMGSEEVEAGGDAQSVIFAGDGSGERVSVTWPDKNDQVSGQLFEGDYFIRLAAGDSATGTPGRFYYTANGWAQDAEAEEIPISIHAGEELELMDFAA